MIRNSYRYRAGGGNMTRNLLLDSNCDWIVELEPGVWLTEGDGDPPRTKNKSAAHRYPDRSPACGALLRARLYRPFKNAILRGIRKNDG